MDGKTELKLIPIGVDDFKKIREEGYYFVDKSELISDILDDRVEVCLFTRPRRFGKSLNLSMLDAFFNVKYNGNTWFDGLKVSDNPETYPHKNIYPVIYLNMKDVPVNSYEEFISKIRAMIYDVYRQFLYLNECNEITDPLRKDYLKTSVNTFDDMKLQGSIKILCEMLETYHGVKPIVLIDEYDNPINNSFNKSNHERIMEFLRNFYSSILKSNEHLSFSIVTGVMQLGKETIFSGINNLYVNNIFSKDYDEKYGFTESEVKELCSYYGDGDRFNEAKEWYDGYRFGNAEIYNPWSLLNYVKKGFEPNTYWGGTSSNDIIDTLIENANLDTYRELQSLAENKPILKRIPQIITLQDMNKNASSVFIVMTAAGYLKAIPDGRDYRLSIPNLEMHIVFDSMVSNKLHSDASTAYDRFFTGMEETDLCMMKEGLDSILQDNIPFFLLSEEKDYQLIISVAAMNRLGRYSVELEKESGNGRADIILRPNSPKYPNIIFELKKSRAKSPENMKKQSEQAIKQIKDKKYFHGMNGRTLLYGICFNGKESTISLDELSL